MDLGLKGRVAAISAASRGLGQATAVALSQEGCTLAICSRDPERIRASAKLIEGKTGGRVLAVAADVGLPEDCERFVGETVGAFGRLDILVTNTADRRPAALRSLRPRNGIGHLPAFSEMSLTLSGPRLPT